MDVSIVIPTYNRRQTVLKALAALANVDYARDRWEAIVVDDGSSDGAAEAVMAWAGETGAPVRCVEQANQGRSVARNRGAAEARGAALIFIDNDIIVERDFLHMHLQALVEHPRCWIVGRVVQSPELCRTPFGRYRAQQFEVFHRRYPEDRISETDGMTTQNVSMPTQDFRRLGGFDVTLDGPEDWDLAWRARQEGIRVLYHPQLKVLHDDWAASLDAFCHRERDYCDSQVRLYRKWGDASPWGRLYRESAPVRWGADSPRMLLKKAFKKALSTTLGAALVKAAVRVTERYVPDSRLNHRTYEMAIGAALFSGVRQSLSARSGHS